MTGDEVLKKALIEYSEEYFSGYDISEDEKPHRFSFVYRLRKISVKRAANRFACVPQCLPQEVCAVDRGYIPLKKMAVMLSVILTAVFLAAAAGAVYFGARGFLFDVHETHSNVSVDFSMYNIKDTIEEVYRLPLESGYELINEVVNNRVVNSQYECGDKSITFAQYTKAFATNLIENTENSCIGEIDVNGNVGFILSHRSNNADSYLAITWVDNGYLFEITGTFVDADELLMLAELIEIS